MVNFAFSVMKIILRIKGSLQRTPDFFLCKIPITYLTEVALPGNIFPMGFAFSYFSVTGGGEYKQVQYFKANTSVAPSLWYPFILLIENIQSQKLMVGKQVAK